MEPFADHHAARARHEDRLARGLGAFARREPSLRPARRDYCPLAALAAWLRSRRHAGTRPATI